MQISLCILLFTSVTTVVKSSTNFQSFLEMLHRWSQLSSPGLNSPSNTQAVLFCTHFQGGSAVMIPVTITAQPNRREESTLKRIRSRFWNQPKLPTSSKISSAVRGIFPRTHTNQGKSCGENICSSPLLFMKFNDCLQIY